MTLSESSAVALTGDGSLAQIERASLFRSELFIIGVEGKPNAPQSTETAAIIRGSANKEN